MVEFYKGHIITLGHDKYDHLSTFPGKIDGKTVEELVKSFHTSRMLCNSCKYNLWRIVTYQLFFFSFELCDIKRLHGNT